MNILCCKITNKYLRCLGVNICNVSTDNIIISKLIETKTNSKCLIRYLDNVIRRLVLILPKMSGYIKTFKVKDGNKDKNNKLMSFCMNDEQLLEKYKAFWTKIKYLKNIELSLLLGYDNIYIYIKTKIRTYVDKVYTNFYGLNVPEDDIECDSFTVIYIKTNITCNYI